MYKRQLQEFGKCRHPQQVFLPNTPAAIVAVSYTHLGMLAATGDDEDKRKEQYDQQMGDQNFAVVLDDGSTYTIDWLAPAAMPLLTGVEVYNCLLYTSRCV